MIVVEDASLDEGFDNLPMFRLPTNGVIRAHRDSANLMEEEEEDENEIMAIILNTRDSRCGASIASRGKFCFATHCNIASHRSVECIPVPGNWYVPVSERSTWAMVSPTVRDEDILDELCQSLAKP